MAIGNLSIDDKVDINRMNNIIGNTDISTSIIGGGVYNRNPCKFIQISHRWINIH